MSRDEIYIGFFIYGILPGLLYFASVEFDKCAEVFTLPIGGNEHFDFRRVDILSFEGLLIFVDGYDIKFFFGEFDDLEVNGLWFGVVDSQTKLADQLLVTEEIEDVEFSW